MAYGLGQQIEPQFTTVVLRGWAGKPWAVNGRSHRVVKRAKHRRERSRARLDPECMPAYRRYHDHEL